MVREKMFGSLASPIASKDRGLSLTSIVSPTPLDLVIEQVRLGGSLPLLDTIGQDVSPWSRSLGTSAWGVTPAFAGFNHPLSASLFGQSFAGRPWVSQSLLTQPLLSQPMSQQAFAKTQWLVQLLKSPRPVDQVIGLLVAGVQLPPVLLAQTLIQDRQWDAQIACQLDSLVQACLAHVAVSHPGSFYGRF